MGNTFNTLAGAKVVQEVLATLLVQFPAIAQITKDFTGGSAKLNQAVNSRVVVPRAAVAFVAGTGYVETDATTIDVPVTISSHIHATFAVTDLEQSSTDRNLRQELVTTNAHALGSKIMTDLFGTVLTATYPLEYESSAANFDRTDIRKVRTALNKQFAPDIPGSRFMVLNSDFAEGPSLDTVVVANPNGSNQGAIASGQLPQIDNFNISEYASLPENGEQLCGIAGNKEAIIMASRVPEVPADPSEVPGKIMNVTEPNTGLTVQLRRYYDMKFGKLVETLTVMYGFAAGLSEAGVSKRLVRIVKP
jgi:hypothetical protein